MHTSKSVPITSIFQAVGYEAVSFSNEKITYQ